MKKLYFIQANILPFRMDHHAGDWGMPEGYEKEWEDLRINERLTIYFIEEEKITYGLKFHKFFLQHFSEFNKSFVKLDPSFLEEVIKKFDDTEIETYANFLGLSEIIYETDHPNYNFFNNEFVEQKEFLIFLKYKLLYNDVFNQKLINDLLSPSEIKIIKDFTTKYKIQIVLNNIDETTYEFLTKPFNIGSVSFTSGVLQPIDSSAYDTCLIDNLPKKIESLEQQGFEVIDNQKLVIDAFYYFYDENITKISNKFL